MLDGDGTRVLIVKLLQNIHHLVKYVMSCLYFSKVYYIHKTFHSNMRKYYVCIYKYVRKV